MASSKPVPIVLGDLHDGAFFAHASQPATRPAHWQRADANASCSVPGVDANVGDDDSNEGGQPRRRGIDPATHAPCVGSPRIVAPPIAPHTAPPAAQPARPTLASKVFNGGARQNATLETTTRSRPHAAALRRLIMCARLRVPREPLRPSPGSTPCRSPRARLSSADAGFHTSRSFWHACLQ